MRVVISEQQLKHIISEQVGRPLISDTGYNAILAFENIRGTVSKNNSGAYTGYTTMNYDISDVKSKESVISSHIKDAITLEQWFKIPDLFRTQIYSFMFNSDSGNVDGYKWIAGLAQSINSTIERGKIIGKPETDPNVQSAIKLINETINNGTINNYYDDYLKVLDSQYLSTSKSNFKKKIDKSGNETYELDANGNKILSPFHVASYKYSWSVRPQEIEKYYNNPPSKKTTPVDVKSSTNKNKTITFDDIIF